MWNGRIWVKNSSDISIFQLVNFDVFSVTFNYLVTNLQLTIRNSQIWLKFSSYFFIFQLVNFDNFFFSQNDYWYEIVKKKNSLNSKRKKMAYFRLRDQSTRKYEY